MVDDLLAAAAAEARASLDAGGIPIGAAVADPTGTVVAAAHNRMLLPGGDLTCHAELGALRALDSARLDGWTLATTMPPCWMCAGAMRHFGLSRLVVVRQPYDSGAAAWLAWTGEVDLRRVARPDLVEQFEHWRVDNPERWPNRRRDDW